MDTEGGRPPPGLGLPTTKTGLPPQEGGGKQQRPRSNSNSKKSAPQPKEKQQTNNVPPRRNEPKEEKLVLGPPTQKSFPSSQRQYHVKNPATGYANGHSNSQPHRRGGPDGSRRPPTRGQRHDGPGRLGSGSRPYSAGNGNHRSAGPRGPPIRDDKRQTEEMWTIKGEHSVSNEPVSSSPTDTLSSLLAGITPDMLGGFSAPTAQESNFIDSLFAGIGLDDDEEPASPARAPVPALSPTTTLPPPSPSPSSSPPPEQSTKAETIEEWTARKEKESRAIGSWFLEGGNDEPLESTSSSMYRSHHVDHIDSKFSFAKKPEFLERRQAEARAKSRPPPGFAGQETDAAPYNNRDRRRAPPGFSSSSSSSSSSSPMDWFKTEEDSWDRQKPRERRDFGRDQGESRFDRRTRATGGDDTLPPPPPGFSRPIAPPPGLEGFTKREAETGSKEEAEETEKKKEKKQQGAGEEAQSPSPAADVQEAKKELPSPSTSTPTQAAEILSETAAATAKKPVTEQEDDEDTEEQVVFSAKATHNTLSVVKELDGEALIEDEQLGQKGEEKVAEGETFLSHTEININATEQPKTKNVNMQISEAPPTENLSVPDSTVPPSQPDTDTSSPLSTAATTNNTDDNQDKTPKKAANTEASIRSKRRSLKNYLPSKSPSPTKNVPMFPLPSSLPPLGSMGPTPAMPSAPLVFPFPFGLAQTDQLSLQQQQQQQQKQQKQAPQLYPFNHPLGHPSQVPESSQQHATKLHQPKPELPQNLPFGVYPNPAGTSSPPVPYVIPTAGPPIHPLTGQPNPLYPPNFFAMAPPNIYNLPYNAKNLAGSGNPNHLHHPNNNMHSTHPPHLNDHHLPPHGPPAPSGGHHNPHNPHNPHGHHNNHNNNHHTGGEDPVMRWFSSSGRPAHNTPVNNTSNLNNRNPYPPRGGGREGGDKGD